MKNRAVMYVRMSTESQDYSTDHQRAKIRDFAAARGMTLIREYVDDGKSGLDIKRREGLKTLMRDVQSTQPDFSHILVYDISRWGRFQDIDEAAYHEHTCRRAGIAVVYCGERFCDDGSPYAALLKSIKRVMAAEYSRDLSEKVFIAQSRFVEMGFKQGGHAGYGLRRLALKACGTPRALLQYGEAKAAVTDRVVLVWGPEDEVATVRRIYSLYLDDRLSEGAIVRLLNSEEIPSEFGRPWTQHMLKSVLTNVKYCGTLAYNRRSCKLFTPRTRNPKDKWVVNSTAVDPIIAPEVFENAQTERARRAHKRSRDELCQLLQDCYHRHGRISSSVIMADLTMPDTKMFAREFGSLPRAYECAGLPHSPRHTAADTRQRISAIRRALHCSVSQLAESNGATVEQTSDAHVLLLNRDLRLRVSVASCRIPKRGLRNWKLVVRPGDHFVITARLENKTCEIADYFLFNAADLGLGVKYVREPTLDQFAASRYGSLNDMFCTENSEHPGVTQ